MFRAVRKAVEKPSLVLIGAGGHARACIDVIESQNEFHIAGLVSHKNELHLTCMGYSVIAADDQLPALSSEIECALIAIGQILSSTRRTALYKRGVELGFRFPKVISPSAYVSRHATIGPGCVIMHGAIIGPGAKVGANCIINTGAVIEHDTRIESHCHISTKAVLNGCVTVEEGCFVGSGTTVKEGVMIGRGSTIGMGLCVRHNIASDTKFIGIET